MDPFARGEGQDPPRGVPASGAGHSGGTHGWESPSPDSPEDVGEDGPGTSGDAGGAPRGLGDRPDQWGGYYSYPRPGYTASSTHGVYGRRQPPYSPYGGPAYRPTGYWTPAPAAPRRARHAALVVVAVIACVGLLVAGLGGGVGTVLYLHSRIGPAQAHARGGSRGRSGNGGTTVDLQNLAAQLDPSIVDITGVKRDATGQTVEEDAGTGVVVSRSGQVLTNNHVIQGDYQLQASLPNGNTYPIKVLGEDPTDDVALVQIQGVSDLHPISLENGAAASMTEQVAAFGNALGRGGIPAATRGQVTNLDQTITASLDNASTRTETLSGLIETSAQICPGDSGGILSDAQGRDLGILTAASTPNSGSGNGGGPGSGGGGGGAQPGQGECSNDGFVIPTSHAIPIVRQVRSGHRSSRVIIGVPGFLGVEVQECTEASTQEGSCQPPAIDGAEIMQLVQGGVAEQAGFPQTFIITAIGQSPITSPTDLTNALEQTTPGQVVQVTWSDAPGSPPQTTTVTLGSGPPA